MDNMVDQQLKTFEKKKKTTKINNVDIRVDE